MAMTVIVQAVMMIMFICNGDNSDHAGSDDDNAGL